MSETEKLETRARLYSKSETKMASSQKKNGKFGSALEASKPVTENEWWEMFQTLQNTLSGVQTPLPELSGLKGKVEDLTEKWKVEVDNKIQVLEVCDSDVDY